MRQPSSEGIGLHPLRWRYSVLLPTVRRGGRVFPTLPALPRLRTTEKPVEEPEHPDERSYTAQRDQPAPHGGPPRYSTFSMPSPCSSRSTGCHFGRSFPCRWIKGAYANRQHIRAVRAGCESPNTQPFLLPQQDLATWPGLSSPSQKIEPQEQSGVTQSRQRYNRTGTFWESQGSRWPRQRGGGGRREQGGGIRTPSSVLLPDPACHAARDGRKHKEENC
jgi:hypothetical protein